jgi:hypothetical protein
MALLHRTAQNCFFRRICVERIIEEIKDANNKILIHLPEEEIKNLLLEMSEMGVLYYEKSKELFKLRKNIFRDMIGSEKEVEDALDKMQN